MPRQAGYRKLYRYQPYMRPGIEYGKVVQRPASTFRFSLPASTRKEVAKIAKRVVNRTSETKNLQIGRADQTIQYVTDYWYELCQNIVVGTTEGTRTSDEIRDVYADLSFHYSHRNSSFDGSSLRIIVIKSDLEKQNHATNWTAGAFGSAFPFLFSAQAGESSAIINKHDYTVLLDTNLRSEWAGGNGGTARGSPGILRVRVKLGNFHYESQTGTGSINYQKFRNIYVIVSASEMGSSTASVAGELAFSGFLYFKDS